MALEEYGRKRRFSETPEPPPEVAEHSGNRFVIQKHRATRLHYDFRLEMEGVLKSWAVPKGPSLDTADKRLAMEVEDHPVSYFDFEGNIPPDNYGAGTVMVWDVGWWEPVTKEAQEIPEPEREKAAREMLAKGDLKFRLHGKKLEGDFVLAKMKSRRPGSKGTEWLLIKHKDTHVEQGYNIDDHDGSVLTGRSIDEIAGDAGSAEWQSHKKNTPNGLKNNWLASSIAEHDKKAAGKAKPSTAEKSVKPVKSRASRARIPKKKGATTASTSDDHPASISTITGARQASMPTSVRPMLATLTDKPFDSADWIYEVKWDGYRALTFINDGRVRLLSRNQNDLTSAYPELQSIAKQITLREAVIDGEVVALDEQGRSSFSLMQQRTGVSDGGRRIRNSQPDIPIRYYVFDLLYADGYSLVGVELEERKKLLRKVLIDDDLVRFSDHFENGTRLYEAASEQKLEGIVAKRRRSRYEQKRSSDWLKIKITRMHECVIGGYTAPRGSRENFGSIVLGLFDEEHHLIHVGQAGSGFTERTHADIWKLLKVREISKNPFANKVESTRRVHFVKPELVAQIKFVEWTHEGQSGAMKMRAPVFLGLRDDMKPEECRFEPVVHTGEAA